MFSCKVLGRSKTNQARSTEISTAHGKVITPAFMPVATRAGVNNITISELDAIGSQIILGGNTFHMLCAPGMNIIRNSGGMHNFMGWHKPMLTDSGGFQIYSLSKNPEICQISDTSAIFKIADRIIEMTPEVSLETQKIIGADIIMAFDQCTPDSSSYQQAQQIMMRTHRWLDKSCEYQQKFGTSVYGYPQALFGIIQGALFKDLRQQSAEFVRSCNTDGIAIGGETIGFNMAKTVEVIRWVYPMLPEDKPRYTMGVGLAPQDLLEVIAEGIDIFDCVAPTRNARHGALYSGELIFNNGWFKFVSDFPKQRLQIKKSCFSNDLAPIMPGCNCYTCQNFSRAYLHDSFKKSQESFTALASIHNIHVLEVICGKIRTHLK